MPILEMNKRKLIKQTILSLALVAGLLVSCLPTSGPGQPTEAFIPTPTFQAGNLPLPTPLPTRPAYTPGELVDYIAQTGDNLPALAVHFNTTVKEIRAANPIIPDDATTLPPGMPMKIPIYYIALWGSPFHILPDDLFVNGPAQIGFDPIRFVNSQPGWLKDYQDAASGDIVSGGELINIVATNFSVSPRLLLALVEYQTGALSQNTPPPESASLFPLGFHDNLHQGLYKQLLLAANLLNDTYYDWRMGQFSEFEHLDGSLERPDPWQNAATVSLQYYYSLILNNEDYVRATHDNGILRVYRNLFGDPWKEDKPHIPGSLKQPALYFPFLPGKYWAFTGGPHTGWGTGAPFAAVDFAPPSVLSGCATTQEWTTAVANGVITRSDNEGAILDLDGDGDERTGWVIFYLHLATEGRIQKGARVKAGDALGHPSCEGGEATGTHVHIARKYNGEWIPAYGVLAFNLEGWMVTAGPAVYQGYLEKFTQQVRACTCSDNLSQISAGENGKAK
jgi:LasA protease